MSARTAVALLLVAVLAVLLAWWTGLHATVDRAASTSVLVRNASVFSNGASAHDVQHGADLFIADGIRWFDASRDEHDDGVRPCMRQADLSRDRVRLRFGVVTAAAPDGTTFEQPVWVQCAGRGWR